MISKKGGSHAIKYKKNRTDKKKEKNSIREKKKKDNVQDINTGISDTRGKK